jgi:2TM domain-containing protein
MTHEDASTEADLRQQAIRSLRKKRDFRSHVVAYVLVNALLVVIWAVTSRDFFWPIFPIVGWGIGLAFNAWGVYGRRPMSEEDILREQQRLTRR